MTKLQAAASPPTEECEGSHTQEEQYRLWQGATKETKVIHFHYEKTPELPVNSVRFVPSTPQIPPKFLSTVKATQAIMSYIQERLEQNMQKCYMRTSPHAHTHSFAIRSTIRRVTGS